MNEEGLSLADRFRRLIASDGPIPVSHFMGESNARYYAARDPLGSAGDFITAPEVSQMFGELIGLWLADIWQHAGAPQPVRYVELGPGRGTLAKDALRAAKQAGLEPLVHFVEGSPALRTVQASAFPAAHWHDDLASVPDDAPILLVANEFLDALPVRQLVRMGKGWRERMVGVQGRDFAFVAGEKPMDAAVPATMRDLPEGTIVETGPASAAIVGEVGRRLAKQGGAALFVDYGHLAPRTGSTLQAVRNHRKVDPLATPGEADLTAHVDFSALAEIAQARGARLIGTETQGSWLRALGIDSRAQALARSAPHRAAEIAAARDRLIGENEMGSLFKVLGLAASGWPDGAGFAA